MTSPAGQKSIEIDPLDFLTIEMAASTLAFMPPEASGTSEPVSRSLKESSFSDTCSFLIGLDPLLIVKIYML